MRVSIVKNSWTFRWRDGELTEGHLLTLLGPSAAARHWSGGHQAPTEPSLQGVPLERLRLSLSPVQWLGGSRNANL